MRTGLAAFALVPAALVTFASAHASAQEATGPEASAATMQSARKRLRQKDFAGAAVEFREITTREPKNAQAWALLGYALHAKGDLEAALTVHVRAASFPAVAARSSYNAACVHALQGRKDDAFAWLAKAREAGYTNLAALEQDADLTSLRNDSRFAAYRTRPPTSDRPFLEDVTLLHDHTGESAGDQFGWVARALGDLTGDGVVDYASTAPYHTGGGKVGGAVYVYSGATGELLWKKTGAAGEQFGWTVGPAGDLDGDGHADFVIGAPGTGTQNGSAHLFSGKTGELLRSLVGEGAGDRYGQDARGVGDVDGDGTADLLVGAPKADAGGNDAGSVYLHSGKTGKPLKVVHGTSAGEQLGGGGVCGVHAGGKGFLAASGINGGPGARGRVSVYSGVGMGLIRELHAGPKGKNLGWFLSVVGDVNADGTPDLYGTDWHDATAFPAAGRAVVWSGKDGAVLHSLHGHYNGEGYGIGVGKAGDVNADGPDDLVVGAWLNRDVAPQAGCVYVHSGKDGSELGRLTGAIPGDVLGFDADGVGDVDGDGVPDLLVTSAYNASNGTKTGRCYVVSGAFLRPE